MPKITVRYAAEDIANRVDKSAVSFGFEFLIPFIERALTNWLNGCGKQEEPNPEKLQQRIVQLNQDAPKKLLRNMTASLLQQSRQPDSEKRLKRAEAEEIARKTIASAVESSPARVASVARSAIN